MSALASDPVSVNADGSAQFPVRLTPNGSADRVEGLHRMADGAACLKCRVRAVPEKGAANAALEKLIARALRIPKGRVSVISGHTARLKTVRISGGAALTGGISALFTGEDP